jgi:hypothetical protein
VSEVIESLWLSATPVERASFVARVPSFVDVRSGFHFTISWSTVAAALRVAGRPLF